MKRHIKSSTRDYADRLPYILRIGSNLGYLDLHYAATQTNLKKGVELTSRNIPSLSKFKIPFFSML